MPIEYLKKATPPQAAIDSATSETVERLLADIQKNGREAVEKYARDFDGWHGDIVVGDDDFAKASKALSQGTKEVELIDGLIAGQKLIPVNTAGCYVPGGRYAHAASAIMSVCTAKVAGVPNIVATSPGHKEAGVNPAILHTMKLCGADTVLALGGVQGIAAMAFGLYSPKPADVIVGPGNRFVAEAKRTRMAVHHIARTGHEGDRAHAIRHSRPA
jgi:sulfopropanediol 3-dehydrogenase